MSNGISQERSYIVPVLTDSLDKLFLVCLPMSFQLVGKNVECLVIYIMFDCCSSFKAVYDKFETQLSILVSYWKVVLEKLCIRLFFELDSFIVQLFSKFMHLRLIQV